MPSHTHTFTPSGNVSSTTATGNISSHTHSFSWSGSHSHTYILGSSSSADSLGAYPRGNYTTDLTVQKTSNTVTISISGTTGSTQPTFTGYAHSHTFTGNAGTTSSNGSGTSFSILPPYVVKYCFERTA